MGLCRSSGLLVRQPEAKGNFKLHPGESHWNPNGVTQICTTSNKSTNPSSLGLHQASREWSYNPALSTGPAPASSSLPYPRPQHWLSLVSTNHSSLGPTAVQQGWHTTVPRPISSWSGTTVLYNTFATFQGWHKGLAQSQAAIRIVPLMIFFVHDYTNPCKQLVKKWKGMDSINNFLQLRPQSVVAQTQHLCMKWLGWGTVMLFSLPQSGILPKPLVETRSPCKPHCTASSSLPSPPPRRQSLNWKQGF